jgi:hypothetical protein
MGPTFRIVLTDKHNAGSFANFNFDSSRQHGASSYPKHIYSVLQVRLAEVGLRRKYIYNLAENVPCQNIRWFYCNTDLHVFSIICIKAYFGIRDIALPVYMSEASGFAAAIFLAMILRVSGFAARVLEQTL